MKEKKVSISTDLEFANLHQSLLRFPGIAQANRQVITPGAVFSGAFIKVASSDLPRQVSHFGNIFDELRRRPTARVPLDFRFLRLYQHAEGDLLRFRYGELVSGELIR